MTQKIPNLGRMIEIVHIRTGEKRELEYVGPNGDGEALLYWPLAGSGLAFDIRTGGGGPEANSWMITDRGLVDLGLGERRAFPAEYLKYREVVAAGRGEVALPPEKSRKRPSKVHPKQMPLIGQIRNQPKEGT